MINFRPVLSPFWDSGDFILPFISDLLIFSCHFPDLIANHNVSTVSFNLACFTHVYFIVSIIYYDGLPRSCREDDTIQTCSDPCVETNRILPNNSDPIRTPFLPSSSFYFHIANYIPLPLGIFNSHSSHVYVIFSDSLSSSSQRHTNTLVTNIYIKVLLVYVHGIRVPNGSW